MNTFRGGIKLPTTAPSIGPADPRRRMDLPASLRVRCPRPRSITRRAVIRRPMATAAPCRAVCLGSPDEHEDRPGRAPFVPGDDFAGPARSTSVVLQERGTDLGTWAGGLAPS